MIDGHVCEQEKLQPKNNTKLAGLLACYVNALHPLKNGVDLRRVFRGWGKGGIVLFTAIAHTEFALLAVHSSVLLRSMLYASTGTCTRTRFFSLVFFLLFSVVFSGSCVL